MLVGLRGESGVKEFEVMAAAGTRRDWVERTLLSAAFEVAFGLAFFRRRKVRTNSKVKSGGQECPPYTFNIPALRFAIGRATPASGAKARVLIALTARLKPCPSTKFLSRRPFNKKGP